MPIVAALAVMALFGLVVYSVMGTLKSTKNISHKPTQTQALIDLPGSVVLVQGGNIYRLSDLQFTEVKAPSYDWVQVEPAPDGDILAVAYASMYTNVYLLNSQGQILRNLLQESSPYYFQNHWAYYPKLSPNGATLFYATDWLDPDDTYDVDFQIQAVPYANPSARPTIWSTPNEFQGGDVEPIPLANGGIIYAKYAVATTGATYAQLVYASSPYANLVYLTTPSQDCAEPALSPSGTEIAMVCTNNSLQTTTLQVASFNGSTLGTPVVVSTGPLPASPTWSANGKGLLYLNTLVTDKASPFQLWWIPNALAAKPSPPQQVTADLDFTATSPPIWSS